MNSQSLTSNDYEKIIHFSSQVAYPVENIRFHIQHKLADIFGYDQTILWSADNSGNLNDPTNYNISDRALTDYLTDFHYYDLLHPKKNVNLFREKKAIRVEDLVTSNQYENSIFYRSFLKGYGYHDEMVVALIHQNTFIGAIGLGQKNSLGKFTAKDSNILKLVSDVIASVLLHQKNNSQYILLSNREIDVVNLVKKGWTNQVIAATLHISVNTVKKHLQNIYEKYNVQNRTQLVQKL